VPIVVLRGWMRRLDKAFAAFFRRCKTGENPGYPRFRAWHRFDSIEIDDLGGRSPVVAGGKRVSIPLLGKVRFKQHRPLGGTPKAMRIKRECGRWFVTIQCEGVSTKPLPPTGRDVGIDLGISTLITTSDGETFENPKALAAARIQMERAQRRVSRRKRGSHRKHKAGRLLARNHLRVANIRREAAIGAARSLVARYDTIYTEDLNIRGLAIGPLSKLVHDAAWGTSLHWLDVKAEEAGRLVSAVDPCGTSQICSGCGELVPKDLSDRIHECPHCGLRLPRDVNAGRNVLARGRRARREALDLETSTTRGVQVRDGGVGTVVSN